jgi:hypothetical protein
MKTVNVDQYADPNVLREFSPRMLVALCDEQIQKKKADKVKESLRGCWKKELGLHEKTDTGKAGQ